MLSKVLCLAAITLSLTEAVYLTDHAGELSLAADLSLPLSVALGQARFTQRIGCDDCELPTEDAESAEDAVPEVEEELVEEEEELAPLVEDEEGAAEVMEKIAEDLLLPTTE